MGDEKEFQSDVSYREFIQAADFRSPRSLTDGEPLAVGCKLNARYVMRKIIGQGVFERLGLRMCDVLKLNHNFPLPLSVVRDVGRHLLESVEFLHRSHVIHTDLKPDNILFASRKHVKTPVSKTAPGLLEGAPEYNYVLPASNTIKVIDFGNACAEKLASNYIIGARPYRAPEVILGLEWSFPSDIWSVGCILAELCMGIVVFNVSEDMEHLAWMEALLGRFPSQMLKRAEHTDAKKYVMEGMLKWPTGATSLESMQRVERLAPLQSEKNMRLVCDSEDFIQLVLHLLKPDPSERLTAKEALNHPFFTTDSLN